MTALEYRGAMRSWATGVAVLTLEAEGEACGITVNSYTSVSLHPPLIRVCIARRARIHDARLRASRFCVNVLSRDQRNLAEHFATMNDAKAQGLLERSFAIAEQRLALEKKYKDELLKVLPAKTVARFFQVESRINNLIDLEVSSGIPLVY